MSGRALSTLTTSSRTGKLMGFIVSLSEVSEDALRQVQLLAPDLDVSGLLRVVQAVPPAQPAAGSAAAAVAAAAAAARRWRRRRRRLQDPLPGVGQAEADPPIGTL